MVALAGRIEQAELYIANVEKLTRGANDGRLNNERQMVNKMAAGMGEASARLTALEAWQKGFSHQGPAAAQPGTQGMPAFPTTQVPSFGSEPAPSAAPCAVE